VTAVFEDSTFRTQTSGTATGDRPATIANGNYLIAELVFNSEGITVSGAPSGWSVIVAAFDNPSGLGMAVYGKYITNAGGEPSTYGWTLNSTVPNAVVIGRFSGVLQSAPFDASPASVNSGNDTTAETPSITTTGTDRLAVSIVGANVATSLTANGSTAERWDNNGGGVTLFGATEVYASAGATTARTHTLAATATSSGVTLALTPGGWSGRTAPEAILGKQNLQGSLTDIDDDPDSPDANWMVRG
jgi:hypothetical protein